MPSRCRRLWDLCSVNRIRRAALWIGVSAACAGGCGSDSVGTAKEGGEFEGEENPSQPPDSDPPESGESSCSMFETSSCASGHGCTPTSHGVRICEDHAVLPIGEACDASDQERCVAGSLCLGAHQSGRHCVEVCNMAKPQCSVGTCKSWFEIDGESVGWCDPD